MTTRGPRQCRNKGAYSWRKTDIIRETTRVGNYDVISENGLFQHGFDIYTRKLVVQYYDRVYVSLDEIVTFICAVENKNPVNVMKSVFTAPLEEG